MATCERTKAALIRRPGYPIGQPAPCYFECCGNEIDAPEAGEHATCPTCGNRFDERGYITPKMTSVRVTFADGNEVLTGINTTLEGAREYYLGKLFNFGDNDFGQGDNMQRAIAVDLVEGN